MSNPTIETLTDIIHSRRTCYNFSQKQVNSDVLEACMEAARWAPNHKLTQPWKFWVIGEQTRQTLADIYADNRASKRSANCPESYEKFYQAALEKFADIPMVVLVSQSLAANEVVRKEDYAASSCAIQNFQLMATAHGLGVQWSTGPILQDERTYQCLGLNRDDMELIGALYCGYPNEDCAKATSKRNALETFVTYLD